MRFALLILSILFCAVIAFASEIREFDIKTLERLGNELTRVSQTRDRGATTPERKRAKQTAMAALRGKLFDIHYDYVVLDDPTGNGFLVYALGATSKKSEVVFFGNFRVTVSTDGSKAERVDALSRTLLIQDKYKSDLPKGTRRVGTYMNQIVSNKPVETLLYSAALMGQPCFVGTPDGKVWRLENGKMSIDRSKPGTDTMGGTARKALGR